MSGRGPGESANKIRKVSSPTTVRREARVVQGGREIEGGKEAGGKEGRNGGGNEGGREGGR